MKTLFFVPLLLGSLIHAHKAPLATARTLPLEYAPLRLPRAQTEVVIDGIDTNIGLGIAYYFRGLTSPSQDIFQMVLNILLPSSPEEDIDYWELIKEDVKKVVGDYIDEHNMAQLEVYKDDLGVLFQRYMEAPVESSTYPDKNIIANSLSTSVIANRYLVEAGERPESMIIHYSDIASIHILVLQDVAETYSSVGLVSRWWQDLDFQLDHYIDYGKRLQNDVVDWRNDMMTCSYDEGKNYDYWTVDDPVMNLVDTCTQLHGTHSCDDHCQAYQITMNREVSSFVWNYLGKSLREWEILKIKASQMASHASKAKIL